MFDVGIEGLDLKRRAIEGFLRDFSSLQDAWDRIAAFAAQRVRAHTPVLTGRLRNSTDPKSAPMFASVRSGGPGVPYAGVVNYGYQVGYMQKADAEVIPMLEPIILAEIDDIIDKRRL